MEIKTDVTLPFTRERVYVTYRDRLAELLPYLPNIRELTLLNREDRDADVFIENQWVGGGDIPAAARAVMKESMLKWTDHATWNPKTFICTWRTTVHAFPGALTTSGENRFVEE